ncbi:copper resistance protein CopC [Ahrensia sp. 13_GOM-1096m]|uniref:copper resistance CopC family protein n=1 Tax=Ahrensia sp. 13_GOM-1096m TaxID=1380380 RepID=UPI0006884B89|nr:copper resistance protein CopC [Ahrensia sp. 13_GOM-1096m]
MKMKSILFSVFAVLFSTFASLAHSPMKSTSPENKATLDTAPEMLHLNFAKPARVLKVVMTHSTADASNEMRMELPTKEAVEEMHLTPEFMGAGNYKIEWRALGEDGHVIKGDFTFDVSG